MTPANIAGMAHLKGLRVLALTDHNSLKNCPAFFAACEAMDIVPIAGVEVTTAEDIHAVCLFPTLEDSMAFDRLLDGRRIPVKNKPAIFGAQQIMNANDEVVGEEPYLLINAVEISLDELYGLVQEYRGICYPAHLDKEANGIAAVLGNIPDHAHFTVAEYRDGERAAELEATYPHLKAKRRVANSDAHYLWDLNEPRDCFRLPDDVSEPEEVRRAILKELAGNI